MKNKQFPTFDVANGSLWLNRQPKLDVIQLCLLTWLNFLRFLKLQIAVDNLRQYLMLLPKKLASSCSVFFNTSQKSKNRQMCWWEADKIKNYFLEKSFVKISLLVTIVSFLLTSHAFPLNSIFIFHYQSTEWILQKKIFHCWHLYQEFDDCLATANSKQIND